MENHSQLQRPRETLGMGLAGRYTLTNPNCCPTIGVHLHLLGVKERLVEEVANGTREQRGKSKGAAFRPTLSSPFLEGTLRFTEPLKLLKPLVLLPRRMCRRLRYGQRFVGTVGSRYGLI